MTDTKARPPSHFRKATRAWWRGVVESWDLDPHHVMILTLAGTAWDRAAEAREAIATHGLAAATAAGGQKVSPFAKIELEAMGMFARLIRELDLDLEAPAEAKRRPMLRSMRGGRVAS